ncbi:MAG: hypothetical protein RL081_1013 [Pseudomonadota bacterium]
MALGATLELERQVDVFHFLLGGGVVDGGHQRGRELALLVNRLAHGFLAVTQLAQVGQAGFQLAQLDVIESAGHFLTVAGDKGHGRAFVQQVHSGLHLVFTDTDLISCAICAMIFCINGGI